jgi:hypothetical protein
MQKEEVLEQFLKLLARAKKIVPLYPPGNPAVRQWVQRLHRGITQFLADGLSFPVRFERDRVLSGGVALQSKDPILEPLQFDLLTRGIKEVSILEGVTEQELVEFLALLNMDPFVIQEGGGARKILERGGVQHIEVGEIAIAPGAAPGEGQEWRTLTLEEWVQLIVDQAHLALTTHLRALALDRNGLSQWLEAVGDGDRTDLTYAGLRTVCGLVVSERESSVLFRTIAEAVFTLPEPLQLALIRDWVFPRIGEDVEALNLVSHFSEDELQRLAEQLPGETFLGLASALADLPWEDVQKQRLLESLTAAIRNRGGFRPVGLTRVDEETVARVRDRVMASFHADRILEIEVRIILALLFKWETDEYPTSAVEALEETIEEALNRGRLDLALEILAAMRSGTVRGEWVAEHSQRSQALFAGAASQSCIVALLGLVKENRTTENAELVTEYLRLVGEAGLREFIAPLTDEQNRSVRAFMCQVLVRMGTAAIPHLRPWVEDQRWYVARNAVTILGQIRDPSTLPCIIEAARYPDPRVRKEAAQVLGTWGVDGALTTLLGLLEDPDPTVQMTLIHVIGRLKSEEAVRALKDLALSHNSRSISFPIREEAIRTLATMRTDEARRVIREIAHRRLWIWQRQERRVRGVAAQVAKGEKLP